MRIVVYGTLAVVIALAIGLTLFFMRHQIFGGGGGRGGDPQPGPKEPGNAKLPSAPKCSGVPPMFEGKFCATTTHYNDCTKGACGYGPPDHTHCTDAWPFASHTAALSTKELNPDDPENGWCDKPIANCGKCFRLTATGGSIDGSAPPVTRDSVVVRITNRCADGFDDRLNMNWCSSEMTAKECRDDPSKCEANRRNLNMYGYSAHFDLMDMNGQVTQTLGWNNPEVTFTEVDCSAEWTCEAGSNAPIGCAWAESKSEPPPCGNPADSCVTCTTGSVLLPSTNEGSAND